MLYCRSRVRFLAWPHIPVKCIPICISTGRILTGCYWFCILIWVSTYTANLAAFLTVKNAAHPIKNLEDIVKTSHQVGVISSSSTQASFKNSQYEPHKKIWQRMKADQSFVHNTSQGVQWVREKESFVFINDGPINQHIANQRPCDLTTSKDKQIILVSKHSLLYLCPRDA